jgi:midasin (ATPase involved in ribosome maturation)
MGSQYTGTHKLDRALLDRFMLVEMDTLKTEDIESTLKAEFPTLGDDKITSLVAAFEAINQEHDEFKQQHYALTWLSKFSFKDHMLFSLWCLFI